MKFPDWRGRTVACLASGPSLTAEDAARVRCWPTVVTNSTFRLCPWADALYWFDTDWWKVYAAEVRETFSGRVFTQSLASRSGVECLRASPRFRSFGNSGASAVAMAVAFGASRVVLLGYDCGLTRGLTHHHGDHPEPLRNCTRPERWRLQFERLARWSRTPIVNASRETTLTCFQRADLDDLLDDPADVGREDGGRPRLGAEYVAGSG